MLTYLLVIATYMLACAICVRVLTRLQASAPTKRYGLLAKLALSHMLLCVVILVLLPFAIFLPVWLVEQWQLIELMTQSSAYFLILWLAGLVASLWLAGRR